MEQLIDIGFTVADADQHRVGAMSLDFSRLSITLQPFIAFFLFDRPLLTLMFLAELLSIARPALHIDQPQRRSFQRKRHRVMDDQAHNAVWTGTNRPQII